MKRFSLALLFILTLRLYDGTVITYGPSWTATICPINPAVKGWTLSIFSWRETNSRDARYQVYDVDDVQYFASNNDIVIKNSEIVTKNEGLWINCNE